MKPVKIRTKLGGWNFLRMLFEVGLASAIWLSGQVGVKTMAASVANVTGIVKDDAGKPLRGAMVTATSGDRSISRFADDTGHYKLEGLKPGNYVVSATAWGFEVKQDTRDLAGDEEITFALAPKWNIARISSADWLSALPENSDTQTLKTSCIRCHNLSWIARNRGKSAEEWTAKVKMMGAAFVTPGLSDAQAEKMGTILEKYFGPSSEPPIREQVKHPAISEAALQATFREYKAPTKSYIHSIVPDSNGHVWFAEFDYFSNKLGRFDVATEEMHEFPMPKPRSQPSNPWVSRDGKVWVTGGTLHLVDPETGKMTEFVSETGNSCNHTLRDDSAANIWCTGAAGTLLKFDSKTQKFQEFHVPTPPQLPVNYYKNIANTKKENAAEEGSILGSLYDLSVDSHDNVWYSYNEWGYIGRLDSKTGEFKLFRMPDTSIIKGLEAGPDDSVWFGNFQGHTLGRLDAKTGKVEQYQPPTHYAALYGFVVDKKGLVWISDFAGSHMTSFDPRTKVFTEYPFPSPDSMTRFFGIDSQGKIWYTEFNSGKIGVLDPGQSH